MNSLLTKIRDKHALWYKGFVFFFAVLICTYSLPKQKIWLAQSVSVGDVWTHGNLKSEIDFLVEKTTNELNTEANNNHLDRYYKKYQVNTADIIKPLEAKFSKQDIESAKKCLDSIYHTGLCEDVFTTEANIFVVFDNEVQKTNPSLLFTQIKAVSYLNNTIKNPDITVFIKQNLSSNIVFDEILTNELNKKDKDVETVYKSKIKKGQTILYKNEILTADKINILKSYNKELSIYNKDSSILTILIGQVLACVLILGIMILFLAFFRKNIFSQNTHVTFIFLIIVLIVLASSIINQYRPSYLSAVPFCLVPIIIRVFFDSRTALFNFLNVVLLCAFFTNDKFEFVFIQLIAGIGTIFSVADMGKRSKLFYSAILTFMFYVLAFVSYHLINSTEIVLTDIGYYKPYIISSLCVLFSFPLIFIFEKLFGFTSNFTLLELCDLDSPLLRELSQKVPGTFQHSLQVANLAEEACYKIGGDALLVRAGAMYHDIGKMEQPRFFTENQVGEVSPHADLSPEESAQIIIGHVIRGVEKAKQYKLPESVIDFIRTHHGTTTTRYFLHNYKKEHEGEYINEELFRYPGPIPFSKETAVLMMADGVEAASRSLKKYDAVAIDELVDKIINHLINENQFINADITFRDINQIKKIFKKRLMNIYHVRIEYPR